MNSILEPVKNKLNIYLLKEKFRDIQSVLKEDTDYEIRQTDLGENGLFCFKDSNLRRPEWLTNFFQDHESIDHSAFTISSICALLIDLLR